MNGALAVVLGCAGLFVVLTIAAFTFVIRRELRRRSQLAALGARLGLTYRRGADPWSIAAPGAEIDEVLYGQLDGVPVALLTLARWINHRTVGSGAPARKAWSLAAVPVAAPVDLAVLQQSVDFPVRLDVQRGWLLLAPERGVGLLHSPSGPAEAERLLRLAVRLGRLVPLRQP